VLLRVQYLDNVHFSQSFQIRLHRPEMIHMNPFRILGDVSHTASKCILIWAIHSNRSAEGNDTPTSLCDNDTD
jgi:hypothetical protein